MSRSTASKPSGGSKSEKRSRESENDSGVQIDASPDEISVDVGVVEVSLDASGEASLGIEIPTPVPGVSALGGIVIDTKTGEIVEVSGGVEIANVTGIEVAVSGCDILTTFYVEIPGTGIRFSYDVEGELPNCKQEEEEGEGEEGQPQLPLPPENYLEEIEKEFIKRNATIARITWISSEITYYRRTGDVRNPLEVLKVEQFPGYLPPNSMEEGFGPALLNWFPNSFSYNFRLPMPNGFPWRKLIYFGGSSDPFGQQEYFTRTRVGHGQLWWIKHKPSWMSSHYIGPAPNGSSNSFNHLNGLTKGQQSAGSGKVNPRMYPTWIEIYEQEDLKYKPPQITSPPTPPRKMDKCCRESLILLEEIHKSLGCEELLDKKSKTGGFEVPRRLLAPGGKGELKHHNYLQILESVIRVQDNLGFHPFKVKIEDTNAAKAGNQGVEFQFLSLNAALEKILYLLVDTEEDGDVHTNMLVRLAFVCTNIITTLATTSRDVETVRDALGVSYKPKTESVDVPFDVSCGQNAKGFDPKTKEEIDLNEEKSTEQLLPFLLRMKKHQVRTTEFDDKDDIKDLLIKILYSIKTGT